MLACDGRQGFDEDFSEMLDLTGHMVSSCLPSTLVNRCAMWSTRLKDPIDVFDQSGRVLEYEGPVLLLPRSAI